MIRKLYALALTFALVGALAGCGDPAKITAATNGVTSFTTAVVNANTALVQLDVTIINNVQKQAALLAPFNCGLFNLGAQIASDPAVADKVNGFMKKNVEAAAATVAVSAICKAVGYPASVTTAASPG